MYKKLLKIPGERELDIIGALWKPGKEILQTLQEQGSEAAYTTVRTMLNHPETKKLVARDNSDRAHRHYAPLKEPAIAGNVLKLLTERSFGDSAEALITRLVEKDLTGEQLNRILSLIDAHKRKEQKSD